MRLPLEAGDQHRPTRGHRPRRTRSEPCRTRRGPGRRLSRPRRRLPRVHQGRLAACLSAAEAVSLTHFFWPADPGLRRLFARSREAAADVGAPIARVQTLFSKRQDLSVAYNNNKRAGYTPPSWPSWAARAGSRASAQTTAARDRTRRARDRTHRGTLRRKRKFFRYDRARALGLERRARGRVDRGRKRDAAPRRQSRVRRRRRVQGVHRLPGLHVRAPEKETAAAAVGALQHQHRRSG
mmetsp:Transcript_29746/g.88974  ORF Transcript_29746/g.88974 Transcript_29746/m.88974 type:complete len:239 (-) Transcript_29746:1385-2101(-)